MTRRTCPHDKNQDGVCGCPEFWKHVKHRPQLTPSTPATRSSTQSSATLPSASPVIDLRSPSPTPAGPPKQTCFFWYHGQCRRGRGCHLEHEVHPAWPIIPPPNYVHREACKLPLCPLRDDLVAFMKAHGEKVSGKQLGGQVDGAAISTMWTGGPESDDGNDSDFDSDTTKDDMAVNYRPQATLPSTTSCDSLCSYTIFDELSGRDVRVTRRAVPASSIETDVPSSPGSDSSYSCSHPEFPDHAQACSSMSDEEFEALPDYSDVEDDPEYDYSEKDIRAREATVTPRARSPLSPPHWLESPIPVTSSSYSDFEDTCLGEVAAAPRATASPGSLVPKAVLKVGTPPPTSDDVEYLNISGGASPPPCSDIENDPLLSLSHAGTLGNRNRNKRRRSPSPHEQAGNNNNNKRRRQEPTPDLSGYTSILQRERRANHRDVKPPPTLERPKRVSLHADPAHNPSSKPDSGLRPFYYAPRGPRELGGRPPICFYWYHKGYCRPARRYGRIIRCTYSHTLDVPHQIVRLPPSIMDHPNCNLELCPVRLQRQEIPYSSTPAVNGNMRPDTKIEPRSSPGFDIKPFGGYGSLLSYPEEHGQSPVVVDDHHRDSYSYQQFEGMSLGEKETMDSHNHAKGIDTVPMRREHRTPVKYEPSFCETSYSSSPRHAITEARTLGRLRGPKFDKNNTRENAKYLPKLTGDSRQRFKLQKERIEQWQMKNGVVPEDPSRRLENRRLLQQQRKESKKKKRRERNRLTALTPKIEDNTSESISVASSTQQDSNAIVGRSTRNRKKGGKGLRSRRTHNLYEADLRNKGKLETYDAEAELYRDTSRPIAGFPDPSVLLDERDEREKKQQSVVDAMEMARAVKETPKIMYPLTSVQPTVGGHKKSKQKSETKKAKKPQVLVDYDLPSGDERLDWDTDEVRRVFGEIEW